MVGATVVAMAVALAAAGARPASSGDHAASAPSEDAGGDAEPKREPDGEPPFRRAVLGGFVLEAGLLEEGPVMVGPELEYGQVVAPLTASLQLVVGGRARLLFSDQRGPSSRVETQALALGPWLELRWLLGARVALLAEVEASLAVIRSLSSSTDGGLVGFGFGFLPTVRAGVAFAPVAPVVLSLAGFGGAALGPGARPVGGLAVSAGVGF